MKRIVQRGKVHHETKPQRFLPEGKRSIVMDLRPQAECCSLQGGAKPTQQLSTTLHLPTPSSLPPPNPALKQGLTAGFRKVCRTEESGLCPFPGLPPGVLEMRVKEGSKIRNLMGFAMARMQCGGVSGQVGLRQVVFTGSGRAVTKTITCAEIMKRKVGGLHQLTKLQYKSVREVWESQEGGNSEMTVHRTVPSISILLSKDPLDAHEPGYQPPETQNALWENRNDRDSPQGGGKRQTDHTVAADEILPKRYCFQSEAFS